MNSEVPSEPLSQLILSAPQIMVKQKKSWLEILTSFESQSRYQIFAPTGEQMGTIQEAGNGLWRFIVRAFLRTHRPFRIEIKNMANQTVLKCHRKFFWFFSDIFVETADGHRLGSAHRRFAIFSKRYTMTDSAGQDFARIHSPFWRIWTFKVFDPAGDVEQARVTKKWGGLAREYFTEADTFVVDFGARAWKAHERAVLFATALSIDFDFFEKSGSGGNILGNILGD